MTGKPFSWAMEQINAGKEIKRISQSKYNTCYGLDSEGEIYIKNVKTGDVVEEVFNGGDVTATDWVLQTP